MVVMAVVVKNLPANAGNVSDMDLIPRSRRYLGGRTHFCILAWRLPRTEESEGLQFIGLQRVGHYSGDLAYTHAVTMLYSTFQ